jgi:hypothetical protein
MTFVISIFLTPSLHRVFGWQALRFPYYRGNKRFLNFPFALSVSFVANHFE